MLSLNTVHWTNCWRYFIGIKKKIKWISKRDERQTEGEMEGERKKKKDEWAHPNFLVVFLLWRRSLLVYLFFFFLRVFRHFCRYFLIWADVYGIGRRCEDVTAATVSSSFLTTYLFLIEFFREKTMKPLLIKTTLNNVLGKNHFKNTNFASRF